MPPGIRGRCGGSLRRRGLANGVAERDGLPARGAGAPTLAARRTSDLGREEPAYAARISRNMGAFTCNSRGSGHTTGLLRACICTCGKSGIGVDAVDGKSRSISAGTNRGAGGKDGMAESGGYRGTAFSHVRTDCGMGGSLGRAVNLSGDGTSYLGGTPCKAWMMSTGCRST